MGLAAGLLIHAVSGMDRIFGAWVVLNRSGNRARAASSVAARATAFASARP